MRSSAELQNRRNTLCLQEGNEAGEVKRASESALSRDPPHPSPVPLGEGADYRDQRRAVLFLTPAQHAMHAAAVVAERRFSRRELAGEQGRMHLLEGFQMPFVN